MHGEIEIHGSKNAVLPILAATVLNKGITRINHCPKIADVYSMIKLLEAIGCIVIWEKSCIIVDATNLNSNVVEEKHVSAMRSSIILLGALLGRSKCVTIAYPGGCSIGKRPIDLHLKALKKMNVEVMEENELVFCSCTGLRGERIALDFPSVGATENIILAATLADGVTVIENAAMEPEISELCKFLVQMGADISGGGTKVITIKGVKELHDIEYSLVSDRIVMGTYMTAVAGIGGDITLRGRCCMENISVVNVLRKLGCRIGVGKDYINISSYSRPKSIEILQTQPYPGFPTDMQSQFLAVLSIAQGSSLVVENIFESRFKTVDELIKMGANIFVSGKVAYVKGVENLYGTDLTAYDLRGGAGLIIAALLAQGNSTIGGIEYIERGYEDICKDLAELGADIKKVENE